MVMQRPVKSCPFGQCWFDSSPGSQFLKDIVWNGGLETVQFVAKGDLSNDLRHARWITIV